ncbi:MAG: efflux RND transporter periplasmic adaptor subunit [Pseudomarimonas sp.]
MSESTPSYNSNAGDMLRELRIDRGRQGHKRRRWPWVLAAVVALGVVGAVLLGGRPQSVETGVARSAANDGPVSVLDASGYVTPRRIATVSSKITGKVLDVLIEEGMQVEEGQILARLDATDAEAQSALAASQLLATEAALGEARATLVLAEQTLRRAREMTAAKLQPVSTLDQAKADFDARRARLAQLQRQVQVARDQLSVTQLSVDNTIIRAPFKGVIVAKAAQPGEMISPVSAGGGFTRTGIGTLVDMDSLEVQVDVNEAYIGRVKPEQPVEAVLNAYADWRIPASVIAIIPTADRAKATVKVRIALGSRDPRIVPDMGVRVSFLDPEATKGSGGGVWVSTRAVVGEGKDAAVFVVVDGAVKKVGVSLGEIRDAERRVLSGLKADEVVVLSPPPKLVDGDRVTLAPAP